MTSHGACFTVVGATEGGAEMATPNDSAWYRGDADIHDVIELSQCPRCGWEFDESDINEMGASSIRINCPPMYVDWFSDSGRFSGAAR